MNDKFYNPVEIPWTFKTWIANFKNVDLPIGDLANQILEDAQFPDEDSFAIIHEYLCDSNSPSVIIETFALVWNFYLTSS